MKDKQWMFWVFVIGMIVLLHTYQINEIENRTKELEKKAEHCKCLEKRTFEAQIDPTIFHDSIVVRQYFSYMSDTGMVAISKKVVQIPPKGGH